MGLAVLEGGLKGWSLGSWTLVKVKSIKAIENGPSHHKEEICVAIPPTPPLEGLLTDAALSQVLPSNTPAPETSTTAPQPPSNILSPPRNIFKPSPDKFLPRRPETLESYAASEACFPTAASVPRRKQRVPDRPNEFPRILRVLGAERQAAR